MKGRTIAVVLLALCAAALPSSAGAATRTFHMPASEQATLSLRGSHGYKLDLSYSPRFGAILQVIKSRGLGAQRASYTRIHPPSGNRNPLKNAVNVRIGRFGHFRGHLVVTSTKSERLIPGCKGPATAIEKGYFVGSFRFRGEEGYTQVRASRARGSITRTGPQICGSSLFEAHPKGEAAAHERGAGRPAGENKLIAGEPTGTFFEAEQSLETQAEKGVTTFSALVSHKVGTLFVTDENFVTGFGSEPAALFQVPNPTEPLAEAIVTPPAPFSGSAIFRSDGAKSGSWTGDLMAHFPGIPPVPLTGGGIEAGLCAGPAGCTETLPPKLQPDLEAPPGTFVTVAFGKATATRASRR